jgi:hypothetical protein
MPCKRSNNEKLLVVACIRKPFLVTGIMADAHGLQLLEIDDGRSGGFAPFCCFELKELKTSDFGPVQARGGRPSCRTPGPERAPWAASRSR